MPLLPLEAFAQVLNPLVGKRIGYVRPAGNVGDQLIEKSTFQLFNSYGIRWKLLSLEDPSDVDELVFAGGGSMGTFYRGNWELRGRALALGLPMTILPQSFITPEDRPYHRIYIRERRSLGNCPTGILAPDMALGLEYTSRTPPRYETGIFIRRDREAAFKKSWRLRDPARICKTTQEYLELAAQYRRIITDRLHFAICALILGRETTLLPNSYFKNLSMYETWLRDFGCKWAATLPEAVGRRQSVITRFFMGWVGLKQPQAA
jgi:exopolysaccharide biosynthesis predicted pyruvyltransferase EpsI